MTRESPKPDDLGNLALSLGVITTSKLHEAQRIQEAFASRGKRKGLGKIMVEYGYVSVQDMHRVLQAQGVELKPYYCASCDKSFDVVMGTTTKSRHCPSCKGEMKPAGESETSESADLFLASDQDSGTNMPAVAPAPSPQEAASPTDAECTVLGSPGPHTGVTLGGFSLGHRIGRGGMGDVYVATQLSMQRRVAVKIVCEELAANPNVVARLSKEAIAAARCAHPNLVAVYDSGQEGSLHFIAMELLQGSTLREISKKDGHLDETSALKMVGQVAWALDFLSRNGLIHRDVKPDNIIWVESLQLAKLLDLGLARATRPDRDLGQQVTQAGVAVGTPTYMAPEQIECEDDIGPPADVYALGATLFHILAGRPPFVGNTAQSVMLKHLKDTPPTLAELGVTASQETENLISMALRKDPKRRPDAGAFAAEVEVILEAIAGRKQAQAPAAQASGATPPVRRELTSKDPAMQSDQDRQLIERLRASGLVSNEDLEQASQKHVEVLASGTSNSLGNVLVQLGYITSRQLDNVSGQESPAAPPGRPTTSRRLKGQKGKRISKRSKKQGKRPITSRRLGGMSPQAQGPNAGLLIGGAIALVIFLLALKMMSSSNPPAPPESSNDQQTADSRSRRAASPTRKPETTPALKEKDPLAAARGRRDEIIRKAFKAAATGQQREALELLKILGKGLPPALMAPVDMATKRVDESFDARVRGDCENARNYASAGRYNMAKELLTQLRSYSLTRHEELIDATETEVARIEQEGPSEPAINVWKPGSAAQPADPEPEPARRPATPAAAASDPPGEPPLAKATPEPAPPPEAPGDYSKLAKRVKSYVSIRKRSICSKCKGHYVIPCPPCKGTGWIYKYYSSLNKVDWNHTRQCMRCNPEGVRKIFSSTGQPINQPNAGRSICIATGCYHGFVQRYFSHAIWDYIHPTVREQIAVNFPGAGADFLSKAIACTLKPNTLEGAPDELADFAAQMGFTPGDFSEALSPHIRQSLEQAFSKTGDITVTPGNPTVNVTFNLTSKGRVVRTFQERITWVWHDGEWYLR